MYVSVCECVCVCAAKIEGEEETKIVLEWRTLYLFFRSAVVKFKAIGGHERQNFFTIVIYWRNGFRQTFPCISVFCAYLPKQCLHW